MYCCEFLTLAVVGSESQLEIQGIKGRQIGVGINLEFPLQVLIASCMFLTPYCHCL